MTKLFFYDLETTGLDSKKHAIHQISGKIICGEKQESFDIRMKPFQGALIDQKALETSNLTLDDINKYPSHQIAYGQIVTMLSRFVSKYDKTDKFHLVGYNNASFDNQFFRELFLRNGDSYFGSFFWSDSLDVMVLASNYLKKNRAVMADFKLKTVAKTLGIEVDESKLHDGAYDIYLTEQIYNIVNGGKE